jgi:nitrogen regulatory protein P-II 1
MIKKIELIIPRERLREINDMLHKHKVGGLTLYEIHGRGRSVPRPDVSRDSTSKSHIDPTFGERFKLEILVDSSLVKPIVDEMFQLPNRSPADYIKIFVSDISEAHDTGTKKSGSETI